MIIFFKIFFLCFLCQGCSPLFSTEAQKILKQVYVCPIPERSGQVLRQNLIHDFGSEDEHCKRYDLKISLKDKEYGMGLGKDAKLTLGHLYFLADYQIIRRSDHRCIASGSVAAQNSYDVLSATEPIALGSTYYSTTKSFEFATDTNLNTLKMLLVQEVVRVLSQKNANPTQITTPLFDEDDIP